MARCKNCGWDNPDNASNCEKCGTPLSSPVSQASINGGALNKTVREGDVFGSANEPIITPTPAINGTQRDGEANLCPKCGYPMRPGVTECPQCGYTSRIIANPTEMATPAKETNPGSVNHAGVSFGGNDIHSTAPVWGTGSKDKNNVFITCQCTLSPVPIPGAPTPADLVVEDDHIELNRQNLDPKNTSISRDVQAELTYENGQWYIQDKSSQHTTFVYAGDKIPLKDGDKILMGGVRLFEFREE